MNSNASIICQSHHNQIYKVQHQKGSRSLASKCPQRISGLSAPERDVTLMASIPGVSFLNRLYGVSLALIEEEEAPPTYFLFSKKKRKIIKGRIPNKKTY
jgi:hypothetical protein